jgi:hypothetical protein
VIEGLVAGYIQKKMTGKRGRPTSVEDLLNGKLHLIKALDGTVMKDCARFEVLTAVVMKSVIFWDIMLRSLLKVN